MIHTTGDRQGSRPQRFGPGPLREQPPECRASPPPFRWRRRRGTRSSDRRPSNPAAQVVDRHVDFYSGVSIAAHLVLRKIKSATPVEKRARPVSYTHLTLPTILRV